MSSTALIFLQDNWKITPKLTLNLGVRYEYQSPYVEQNNRVANLVVDPSDRALGTLISPGAAAWNSGHSASAT